MAGRTTLELFDFLQKKHRRGGHWLAPDELLWQMGSCATLCSSLEPPIHSQKDEQML